MITQRRLRHLLLLVEYAHFGRAAAALNISQPALTKSIQALEAELGVMLLDRKRGAVVLTAFGELVVQRSRALLNAEEDLLREITLLAGLEIGSLRVALGPPRGEVRHQFDMIGVGGRLRRDSHSVEAYCAPSRRT